MRERQTYQLKLYDRPLAQFQFERTLTGFRAGHLEVDPDAVPLLPLNLAQVRNDVELVRFLESRRIPKGRAYLEEVLRPYGLAPSDTKGIIDLSRGASANDAYSVVPADDDIPYAEYNLFDNAFDEVLQVIAYTGAIPRGVVGTGRPSTSRPPAPSPRPGAGSTTRWFCTRPGPPSRHLTTVASPTPSTWPGRWPEQPASTPWPTS